MRELAWVRRARKRRSLSLRELILQVGHELVQAEDGGDPLARRERVVRRLWEDALKGEIPAIRLLVEYTDGKPASRTGSEAGRELPPVTADELEKVTRELAEWEAECTSDATTPGGAR